MQRAILEDLKTRSGYDPARTTVRVAKVVFLGNRAEADVAFRFKGGELSGLDVHYSLSREGKGWKVDARQPFPGRGGRRVDQNPDGVEPGVTPPGTVDLPPPPAPSQPQ